MNRKNTLQLLVLLYAAVALAGCGKTARADKGAEGALPDSTAQAIEVDALLAGADSLVGQTVTVSGVCTHICRHGGKKIFLMGTDDTQTIRVEAGEAVGSFAADAVNSLVQVTGLLQEQRIDEAYLSEWEAELKAQTAERHGEEKAGCAAEQKAHNESPANSPQMRIDNFRRRIAERREKEGKDYLSFYFVEASTYEIK